MNISRIINQILPQASTFSGVFFVVMALGYGFLYMIDFVPEPVSAEGKSDTEIFEEEPLPALGAKNTVEETPAPAVAPLPLSITIDALNREVTVLNPTSNTISAMDEALLKGVIRHPDSDDLTGPGNILILGHSSYLRNVLNKNFQAFNGLQNLKWGDTIRVKTADYEYTYKVDRVYKAEASAVDVVTGGSEYRLTLVTCNTLGAKEDRFIVEAVLASKKAL